MTEERKLSIYVAEQPWTQCDGDVEELIHHTALLLVDESGDEIEVVQQLHFNNYNVNPWLEEYGESTMVPNIRHGLTKSQSLDDMYLYPVIGGREYNTLHMWNHMLRQAVDIREQELRFDLQNMGLVYANNCRAGIIASLKSIGIPYDPAFYKSEAGSKAGVIRVNTEFSFASLPQVSLQELQIENEALCEELIPPWELEKRALNARFPRDDTHLGGMQQAL